MIHTSHANTLRDEATIDLVVIHHTATPDGRHVPVDEIDRWHQARGFHRDPDARRRWNGRLVSVGYHHVIYPNGAAATGRAPWEIGAHASGHNRTSIGIAMCGMGRFTDRAWASLAWLLNSYRKTHPAIRICGHHDLPNAATECPGFDVATYLREGPGPSLIYDGVIAYPV